MTAAEEAARYADRVLALIPSLIDKSVEERRTHACWYEIRARRRLQTCRPIMRPFWRWRVAVHDGACAANEQLAHECATARMVVAGETMV